MHKVLRKTQEKSSKIKIPIIVCASNCSHWTSSIYVRITDEEYNDNNGLANRELRNSPVINDVNMCWIPFIAKQILWTIKMLMYKRITLTLLWSWLRSESVIDYYHIYYTQTCIERWLWENAVSCLLNYYYYHHLLLE